MRPKIDRLKDNAWKTFSEYIRKKTKKCYTCGAMFWNEQLGQFDIIGLEAGHFKHGVLDFDEMNIHPQCSRCNHFYSGKLDVYAENLIRDYGLEKFNDLCNRAKEATKGHKYTEQEYEEIIKKYKEKIIQLEQ